jgi:hypothetical protein
MAASGCISAPGDYSTRLPAEQSPHQLITQSSNTKQLGTNSFIAFVNRIQ